MNPANAVKKNILLVEDERATGLMVRTILGKKGYNTLIAYSGEEAVEAMERIGGIDLILMDINLGDGMDGTEAAHRILQKYDLPIVFLSSHIEHEVVEKTERISSYGYVVKNSEEAVLLASIRMAFKLFDARIRERKGREALQRSEEKYRGMFDNSLLGIFQTTLDGRCHMVNRACARMLGYDSPEEARAAVTDIATQFYADPGERTRLIDLLMVNGSAVKDFEVQMKRKDGSKVWALLNTRLVYDEEENIPLIEGMYCEITGNKLSDEKICNLLQEKELILNEVHHRIKTNITAIYSLLAMQAGEDSNPAIKKALHDAAGRIRSMMILYDRLYRLEDAAELSIGEYLPALIRDTIEMFPGKDSVRIITRIEDIVLGARILTPVGIVVYELVTNAMRHAFGNRGGGVITVQAFKNDGKMTILFQDSGCGLPESISLKSPTGFGLQLINMLVIQMNGSISIESDNGTRFTMSLPIE